MAKPTSSSYEGRIREKVRQEASLNANSATRQGRGSDHNVRQSVGSTAVRRSGRTPEERFQEKMRQGAPRNTNAAFHDSGGSLDKERSSPAAARRSSRTPEDRLREKIEQGAPRKENPAFHDSGGSFGRTPEDRIQEKLRQGAPRDANRPSHNGGRSWDADNPSTANPSAPPPPANMSPASMRRSTVKDQINRQELSPPKPSSGWLRQSGTPVRRVDGCSLHVPPPTDKHAVRENLGVGAVAIPGPDAGETMPSYVGLSPRDEVWPGEEESFATEIAVRPPEQRSASEIRNSRVSNQGREANETGESETEGKQKNGAFCVICGVSLTRFKCLLLTALMLAGLVAVIVGVMAGMGAFSRSANTAAGEGTQDEGAVSTLSLTPNPTASPTAGVPTECKQSKLPRKDGRDLDFFGRSVAVDGDTIAVGADRDGSSYKSISGSVYIYARVGAEWKEQARLQSSDSVVGDRFGRSVAIEGDTVVFGAVDRSDILYEKVYDIGCAYVFTRMKGSSGRGAAWVEQAKLLPEDPNEADVSFGSAVALDGDTIIVGMDASDFGTGVNSGSAYVYTRSNDGQWKQKVKIVPEDGKDNDRFGHSVAVHGNTVVIGATRVDASGKDSGAAYVYTLSDGKWTQQAKLMPKDGAANDGFGKSVAINGNTVVIGARSDDDNYLNSGSAYVFVRDVDGTTWAQQAKLLASDAQPSDFFGLSVSVDGETAVIGSSSGAAYVFDRILGTTWTFRTKLFPSLHNAGDGSGRDNMYGESVNLSEDTVVIGAFAEDEFGEKSGNAYAMKLC